MDGAPVPGGVFDEQVLQPLIGMGPEHVERGEVEVRVFGRWWWWWFADIPEA